MGHPDASGVVGEEFPTASEWSLFLFVVATLSFGTVFVGIKAGLRAGVPPVGFAALRFAIAALLLLPAVALREGRWLPRTRSDVLGVGAGGVFIVGLNGVLLFVGQQYTTSGAAAVVYSLLPLLVTVLAVVALPGETITRTEAFGVLVGFAGVVLVVNPDPSSPSSGALGQLLVAGSALSSAVGSVLLRRLQLDLPDLPLTAWAMALGAVLVAPVSLALGESYSLAAVTPTAVLSVLYVGVAGTAVGFPAYFALIDRVGAVRANLISYAVPVVATVTGVALLGEQVAPSTAAGFLVIASGFVLVERDELATEVRRLRAAVG